MGFGKVEDEVYCLTWLNEKHVKVADKSSPQKIILIELIVKLGNTRMTRSDKKIRPDEVSIIAFIPWSLTKERNIKSIRAER